MDSSGYDTDGLRYERERIDEIKEIVALHPDYVDKIFKLADLERLRDNLIEQEI